MEMQKRALVPYVIFACVLPAIVSAALAQREIPWLDNYSEAIREAKRTQKPIFLEFRCEP
jgi:lipopolysaccharide export LptBFGC system permease protein LptF